MKDATETFFTKAAYYKETRKRLISSNTNYDGRRRGGWTVEV